jgi:AcrR family transcriptional regulator
MDPASIQRPSGARWRLGTAMAQGPPARTKEELVKEFRTGEILRAARQVIAELGLGEASMERIAQGAGISKGTIYLYFQNKEQLLVRAVAQAFEELMARLKAAVSVADAGGAGAGAARLRALVQSSLEHAMENRGFFRALMEPRGLGPESVSELTRRFAVQNDQYVDFVASVVEAGARRGEFRDLPPRLVAVALAGALRGAIAERIASGAAGEPGPDANAILDLLLHGVIGK